MNVRLQLVRIHFNPINFVAQNYERDTKNFNSHLMLAQNFKQKLNVCLKSQTENECSPTIGAHSF
jgi:hypothetical protein